MVAVTEKVEIRAEGDAVWAVVSDPVAVAACIPGAMLTPEGEDAYAGSIKVKFGPTAVTFNGRVTLSYDHAGRRCAIEGRGRDGRGASNALATGTVAVAGGRPAVLSVDGEFQMSGPLEAFARTGGVHVARALLADFARNVEARVATEQPSAAEQPAATPAKAAGLSGFALLWRVLRSWIGGLLGRRAAP